MTDNNNNKMTDLELNSLATRIVSKMMQLKTMEDWFDHVRESEIAATDDYASLSMNEEEHCLGELAKLMTLLSLFQDKEQYEKCATIKRRIEVINDILSKYK